MSLIGKLYRQFQHLIHELAKFGVVGRIGFVVTEVGINLLHFRLGIGPFTSNVIATAVATASPSRATGGGRSGTGSHARSARPSRSSC